MPGPWRSARVTVSPGIGRLLSSLEFGSGLLEEERSATKSFNCEKRRGSIGPTTEDCAWARGERNAPRTRARAVLRIETSCFVCRECIRAGCGVSEYVRFDIYRDE